MPISHITIETLQNKDKEAVRQLLVESYFEYKEGFSDLSYWEEYKATLEASVDNPNVEQILVAKEDEVILGTLQLFTDSTKAYEQDLDIHAPIIRLLAVSPLARGKGIARALIQHVVKYAQTIKAKSIYLHTNDRMVSAIQLYERFGFVRDTSKEFFKYDDLVQCYRYDIN